jgi:outer membrane biosynthesis protein TonB
MENRGLQGSLILHGLLVLFALFGLPNLFKKDIEPVNLVTVELVPISSLTNVPKAEEPVKPKDEPKKEEPKIEKKAPPPPPPPPPKEEPKPEPEKPQPPEPEKAEPLPEAKKEKPTPKPKAAPPVKPIEKPKKKEEKLDFDSVLKTVEKIEKKQAKEEQKEEKKDNDSAKAKAKTSSPFDANQPLSISERDAIIQQISQCWSIPAGAKDAQDLSVLLHLSLEKDGTVRNVKIADTVRYASADSFYQAAADSAVRAVRKCSPLKNLPQDKYDTWKEIEMNFDPKEMLY